MDMNLSALYDETHTARIRDSHTYARILHGTADPNIRMAVVNILYRLQGLCKTR